MVLSRSRGQEFGSLRLSHGKLVMNIIIHLAGVLPVVKYFSPLHLTEFFLHTQAKISMHSNLQIRSTVRKRLKNCYFLFSNVACTVNRPAPFLVIQYCAHPSVSLPNLLRSELTARPSALTRRMQE